MRGGGVTTAGLVLDAMQQLPDVDLKTLLGEERPLIVAPHPDDESLGCGGLIAACCEGGRPPFVVILTDGAASHPGSMEYPPDRLRALRAQEARRAVAALGLAPDNLAFFSYPDTALPSGPEVSARVARLAKEQGCNVILAPWLYDPHCDHESAAIIARDAARLAQCRLLSYPVWGWLLPPDQQIPVERVAGCRLPIPTHLQAKQSAVAAHASQYSDLIDDSPDGFRLPPDLLAIFERPYEVFLYDE
jgi:LmbE family N-acetylglucosaminyl deacetylase